MPEPSNQLLYSPCAAPVRSATRGQLEIALPAITYRMRADDVQRSAWAARLQVITALNIDIKIPELLLLILLLLTVPLAVWIRSTCRLKKAGLGSGKRRKASGRGFSTADKKHDAAVRGRQRASQGQRYEYSRSTWIPAVDS